MVKTSKHIIRFIYFLLYIIAISILLFLISSLYSYLNTGADRSKMLHLEVKKIEQYLPKINWKEDGNIGRVMDDETLKNLENDYLDAWYVLHTSQNSNTKNGLKDYYTKNSRKKIYNNLEFNKKQNITIDGTTISHNLDVLFFSEDGQLIVLEDKNVLEYKSVYKKENFQFDTRELSDYKVMLLLEDGFWRIRHKVKENVTNPEKIESFVNIDSLNIKGINYYPQKTPWNTFGDQFDSKIIDADFKLIKNAGLNSIRIFIPYEDFGKAKVKNEKLEKLNTLLDLAEKNELKVVITLFDLYGNYNVLDWTLNHRHAETIVTKFKNHNALLAWDLKNEPNLDFESRGKQNVLAWLEHLSIIVKKLDSNHPVTIGWSNIESAYLLSDKIDFISFHYYDELKTLEKKYKDLKSKVNSKRIVLTEFGLSSYSGFWKPFASSKNKQAKYHEEIQKILSRNNMSFMAWTLYDFEYIPSNIVGSLPWRRAPQKKFGFIDSKGRKKPSFKYISR